LLLLPAPVPTRLLTGRRDRHGAGRAAQRLAAGQERSSRSVRGCDWRSGRAGL